MSNSLIEKFKNSQSLSRLKSHDKDAFIKAYDDNVGDIYRFVYFKVGSREEANDLTSTVFLKTWNYVQTNSLEDSKTLRALLYKVARTTIIDYYRENNGRINASLDDEENKIEIIDDSINLENRFDTSSDLALIKSRLPLLKEEYREVIIMRFINDLTLEEIADISGKKKGNVRVLLHRAIGALKELVTEEMEVKKASLKTNQ